MQSPVSRQVVRCRRAHLAVRRQRVRAVVRDANKGSVLDDLGCEVAIAEMEDAEALTRAFMGVTVSSSCPRRSSIRHPGSGGQGRHLRGASRARYDSSGQGGLCRRSASGRAASNLLSQLSLMEEALSTLPLPVTFLRPAWFMENLSWDVAQARNEGVISSFLQPLDKAMPMVATADVGRVAAELLLQDLDWQARRRARGPPPGEPERIAAEPRRRCIVRFAQRRFRARTGTRSFAPRECVSRFRASRCSTDSTRVGSNSRVAARP